MTWLIMVHHMTGEIIVMGKRYWAPELALLRGGYVKVRAVWDAQEVEVCDAHSGRRICLAGLVDDGAEASEPRRLLGRNKATIDAIRTAERRIQAVVLPDTGLGASQSADQETFRELVDGPLGRHLLAIGTDRYERARASARSEISSHTDRPGKGLKLVGVLGVLLAALLAREVIHQRRRARRAA